MRHGGSVRNARTPPVSIHALLAECDTLHALPSDKGAGFNPRTPCGVRPVPHHCLPDWMRFNPRTPCGVRHAMLSCAGPCRRFQSTHSLRSATGYCWTRRQGLSVSIHALLAECDEICNDYKNQQYGFNPRTPCGVRLSDWFSPCPANQFQSTHSLRSATPWRLTTDSSQKFQSTHSLRSATNGQWGHQGHRPVSIHALLAECDTLEVDDGFVSKVSIHALLAECDHETWICQRQCLRFNPRTPCGVRLASDEPLGLHDRFQSTHSLRSATTVKGRRVISKQFQSTHSLRSATH